MSENKDFSSSLHLPKTSFPMKARLQEKEPEIIKSWQDKEIHKKMVDKRKDSPTFFMQDGPPYANGKIHLGHVLNKILKDGVINTKTLWDFILLLYLLGIAMDCLLKWLL